MTFLFNKSNSYKYLLLFLFFSPKPLFRKYKGLKINLFSYETIKT